MSTLTPAVKIEIIQRSLGCFVRGLLALLPVVGLPLAILALGQRRTVRRLSAGQWNPAERYLSWGAIFASVGLALGLIEVAVVGMIIAAQLMP